jgi:hypothetical protein
MFLRLLPAAVLLLAGLFPTTVAAQTPQSTLAATVCYRGVCVPDSIRDVTGGGGGFRV